MNGFVWLASYPKSGNTWLRVVLANLLGAADTPAGINALPAMGLSHSAIRRNFDDLVGYEALDLTDEEIDLIRPDLYSHMAARAPGPCYSKVHDACRQLPDGRLLFPPEATAGAIYVIRNPLDVCVSYAHHAGEHDFDAVVASMADSRHAIAADWLKVQLRQRLLTWSGHVLSWVDARPLAVHVVRYEDMHAAPLDTFAAVAAFAGIPADRDTLTRAVAFSSIEELQRQEREHGFDERPSSARPFFRQGRVGSWRESLTDDQARRIIDDHRDVMRRFGYLTDTGDPVYSREYVFDGEDHD